MARARFRTTELRRHDASRGARRHARGVGVPDDPLVPVPQLVEHATAVMKTTFDEYAGRYDSALNMGLSLSGESREYFAQARVDWLAGRLRERGAAPQQVLDFGCGTGDTCPELLHRLNARLVVGVDPSLESVATARRAHSNPRLRFEETAALEPSGQF